MGQRKIAVNPQALLGILTHWGLNPDTAQITVPDGQIPDDAQVARIAIDPETGHLWVFVESERAWGEHLPGMAASPLTPSVKTIFTPEIYHAVQTAKAILQEP